MPARGVPFVPHASLPTLEDLRETAAWLAERLAVDRVKITGGEPLVRRGLVSLVDALCRTRGVSEVSMTTNATLLEQWAPALKRAGLRRVNVSLDSLDPGRFRDLTRGGSVEAAVRGIEAARREGFAPIKINSVLRRSTWDSDVPALLDFASERGLELRFIELMRTGAEESWARDEYVPAAEVRARIGADEGAFRAMLGQVAPARMGRLVWRGRTLAVGWITPVSHAFCTSCNRLRLDARGRVRRCLMDPSPLPLVDLLKREPTDVVEVRLREYLAGKRPPVSMAIRTPMNAIGG